MKEPAYVWRTKRIRNRLAEALAMRAEIISLPHREPHDALCRVYLAAARELADGVISELDAHRPTNAMRLARHLWEYEQELA